MNKKLKVLADLLLEKGFHKEACELSDLAKIAFVPAAIPFVPAVIPFVMPVWGWVAAAVGTTALGTAIAVSTSEDSKSIMKDLTPDFANEEAGPLYKKWYNELSTTDLIDGAGTFPTGDPNGGAFMREFIHKKWKAKSSMSVEEFEGAFEKYYGGGASNPLAGEFGLDNEDGWVDSYNAILSLWKGQDTARKEGKDWRTDEPLEEDKEKAAKALNIATKDSKETEEPQAKLSPKNLLTLDSRGKAVVRLQKALIAAGFDLPKHGVDGHFGAETKAAVLAFKRKALADGRYEGKGDVKVTPDIIGLIESYNKANRFNAPEDEDSEASESSKAHRFNAPESEASESSEKKSRFNDP